MSDRYDVVIVGGGSAGCAMANRLSAVALLPVSAALAVLGTAVSVALFFWKNVSLDGAQQIGLTVSVLAIGLLPLLQGATSGIAMSPARPAALGAIRSKDATPTSVPRRQAASAW